MPDYLGSKCPVCQQPFVPGDDIVVCPECGAPYHRDCYQKHGSCVFADKHGSGFEWKPDPTAAQNAQAGHPEAGRFSDPQIACPVCGTPNPATGLFCENCGSPLSGRAPQQPDREFGAANYRPMEEDNSQNPFAQMRSSMIPPALQVQPDEELEGIPARHWAAFLGQNAPYFLVNFKGMQATGRRFTACFSAFFFGPFYFFYRKLWGPALAFWVVESLLRIPVILQVMVATQNPWAAGLNATLIDALSYGCSLLNIGLMFVQGMLALDLYRKAGVKRIRAILAQTPAEQDPSAALAKAGGTSRLALAISLVAALLLLGLASTVAVWHTMGTLL